MGYMLNFSTKFNSRLICPFYPYDIHTPLSDTVYIKFINYLDENLLNVSFNAGHKIQEIFIIKKYNLHK